MSALLSVASTLLGGVLGQVGENRNNARQERLIREQNAYNAPDQVRARAEKAGFNPLLFTGPGVGQQTATAASSSSNYMGNAIADAGLIMADAIAKRKDAMRLSRMEDQNRRLTDKVQALTLRPQVGGIYAQIGQTPTIASALGGRNGTSGQTLSLVGVTGSASMGSGVSVRGDFRPLLDSDPTDPRREVDNKKATSHAGFMWLDNPYLPSPLPIPTLDGEEAIDITELPTLLGLGGVAVAMGAYKGGQYMASGNTLDAGYAARVRAARYKAAQYALSLKKPKRRPNPYDNYMTLPHGGPLAGFR